MLRLIILMIFLVSCGESSKEPGVGDAAPCTASSTPVDSLICVNSQLQIKPAGYCSTASSANPDDCPPPYNFCDSNNNCAVQKISGSCLSSNDCASGTCTTGYCAQPQNPAQQTWFATDPIRPGITVNSSNPKDYIYNIMAKGYESIDDWCLSQAQQSTLPAMRKIASWTGLIIAQPDNSATLSASGLAREQVYLTANANPGTTYFQSPAGTKFASNSYNITDKNGVNLMQPGTPFSADSFTNTNHTLQPNGNYWLQGAWSGIVRKYTQQIVCAFSGGACRNQIGTDNQCCGDVIDYVQNACGGFGAHSQLPFCTNNVNCDIYDVPNASPPLPGNLCAANNINNSWSASSNLIFCGVATMLNITTCTSLPGFDFVVDGYGMAPFNTNASQQKPIICLANQASN
ncbi:MAG: hypothetical protein WCK49_04800 [Myxococcaceae bacterium]